jgi:hypothetical protein
MKHSKPARRWAAGLSLSLQAAGFSVDKQWRSGCTSYGRDNCLAVQLSRCATAAASQWLAPAQEGRHDAMGVTGSEHVQCRACRWQLQCSSSWAELCVRGIALVVAVQKSWRDLHVRRMPLANAV